MKVDEREIEVFLSLGSNLGNKSEQLLKAIKKIETEIGKVIRLSSVYETEAWGSEELNTFYNQVICIRTSYSAEELLIMLKKIEKDAGRKPSSSGKYENRVIDIDILLYGNEIINKPGLIVPHEHLSKRNFVLVGLNEITPLKMHPIFKKTVKQLYIESNDRTKCNKIS